MSGTDLTAFREKASASRDQEREIRYQELDP
jgi:hypothetical protein